MCFKYLIDSIVLDVLLEKPDFLLEETLTPILKKILLEKIYSLEIKLGKKIYKIVIITYIKSLKFKLSYFR